MKARLSVLGALAALAALVGVVTSSGHTVHPPSSASHARAPLPAGWARFSYGPLTVAAPRGWKVQHDVPPSCVGPPPNTVSEYTLSEDVLSSCPSRDSSPPLVGIDIVCLVDAANGTFTGAPWKVARGATLRRSGLGIVLLQSSRWESMVVLDGDTPASLGRAILGTVEPTGKECPPDA
jgi:hypothetical protein